MFGKIVVMFNMVTALVSGGIYTGATPVGSTIKVYNQKGVGPIIVERYDEGMKDICEYYDGNYTYASTYLVGDAKSIVKYAFTRLY